MRAKKTKRLANIIFSDKEHGNFRSVLINGFLLLRYKLICIKSNLAMNAQARTVIRHPQKKIRTRDISLLKEMFSLVLHEFFVYRLENVINRAGLIKFFNPIQLILNCRYLMVSTPTTRHKPSCFGRHIETKEVLRTFQVYSNFFSLCGLCQMRRSAARAICGSFTHGRRTRAFDFTFVPSRRIR